MSQIVNEFFASSSIPDNPDSRGAMELLAKPESVAGMIAMSEAGIPALVAVVHKLEAEYATSAGFPLTGRENATNRRNTGWMIRYIMREFGYSPVDNPTADRGPEEKAERTRLKRFTGTNCFSTSAVYSRTNQNPPHTIAVTIL